MKFEEINLLLVDNEVDFLEQAKSILKEKDERFVIETSKTVKDALKRIENKNIDVIVSDYRMPDKDGIEFLRILREEKDNSIPFIIFTGRGWEEVAMNALNFGANKYIWKKEELTLYDKKQEEPAGQYDLLAKEIVNEFKKLESKKTLEFIHHIIERSKDGIFCIAPDGRILYGNKNVRDMLGYDKRELQDMNISDIDSRFQEDERDDFWKRLKEEKSITLETEQEGKDGTILPVKMTSNYLKHEDRELEFAFIRENTE
ncbi:MAG: response regulator [Candidatus Natronoplasma sp.]